MALRGKMFSSETFLNSANCFIVFNYVKCRKQSVKVSRKTICGEVSCCQDLWPEFDLQDPHNRKVIDSQKWSSDLSTCPWEMEIWLSGNTTISNFEESNHWEVILLLNISNKLTSKIMVVPLLLFSNDLLRLTLEGRYIYIPAVTYPRSPYSSVLHMKIPMYVGNRRLHIYSLRSLILFSSCKTLLWKQLPW